MNGPLQGLKVIELAGLGPAPLAAMLLADLGADVVRVDRPGGNSVGYKQEPALRLLNRGKSLVELDLKQPESIRLVLDMVARADVLIEGYRPGVAERLGLGPEACTNCNSRLVYGRITGWGREGPLAMVAGHDVNYLALSGALAAIGTAERPAIPLNLIGDFGGGSVYLVFGIMSALFERSRSGLGQVVDAAMIDGVASMLTTFFGQRASGNFQLERESNLVDGGAPFYSLYKTADQQWISIGAIEPKFFAKLISALKMEPAWAERQYDREDWPALREAFTQRFAERTRAQWCALLESLEVCFAPVLTLDESPSHGHHVARGTYVRNAGVVQPAASPRFDRTPAGSPGPVPVGPMPAREILSRWQAS